MPSLPTDSLYKFLALSGLFLIVFCVWARHSLHEELMEDEATVEVMQLAFRAEVEEAFVRGLAKDKAEFPLTKLYEKGGKLEGFDNSRVGERYEIASATFEEKMIFRANTNNLDKEFIVQSQPVPGEPKPEIRWTEKEALSLRNKLREEWAATERLWRKAESHKGKMAAAGWGIAVGILLCLVGVPAWYLLVQRHQDQQIIYQAMKTKADALAKPVTKDPPPTLPRDLNGDRRKPRSGKS